MTQNLPNCLRAARAALATLLLLPMLMTQALAVDVRSQPTPGGIVQIDLLRADQPRPIATLQGRRVMLIQKDNYWRAVIGIGLNTPPGQYELTVAAKNHKRRNLRFSVAAKHYPVQRLHIADARKVNPAAEDLQRIEDENQRIRRAKENWTITGEIKPFLQPVQGSKSSSFGLRRILNGEPKQPHGGMDIAAPTGTPIVAPVAGRVIESGDFFYTGNTVMLDHGQGLISLYAHLHTITVALGDELQRGQILGQVGATGRVTGPHLHWAVGLNGQWIDPELFLR